MKKNRLSTSFRHAFEGIEAGFNSCPNMKIHISAALLAIIAGFIFVIHAWEWVAVIICISLVISLELINSSIEEIVNFVSPEIHPKAKFIKDVAAGSVLVVSFAAFIIGLIIFLPKALIMFS